MIDSIEFLFINTAVRGRFRFVMMSESGEVMERVFEDRRDAVQAAEEVFGVNAGRAKGIIVVAGPGSFSAVRSGVLLANVMSRTLRIPLYGIQTDEAGDLASIRERIHSRKLKPSTYVAPVYDAEPNITVKKQ